MDDLIGEIQAAVRGNAWILALAGALALPDMCAALASSNGETTGAKYKAWWKANLGPTYPNLDADEIYKMRCSMLHQGRSATRSYARVIFIAPGGPMFHNNVINDAMNLDLPTFCNDVITAVEKWRKDEISNPVVLANAEHLLRWHRGGLSPYIVGIDVLT
ncbi:hypothetical protein [Rhodococcus sp. SORGH_AS_0301]|uniref:hypothetical protein n=1 Tax=Rhodococcus sp. SORGH_AS_0301 TaxID=3041780 RepID=UPI00278A79C3|nr:hypothetical protein [Rhodococcus sp. SORGH_AS_0301]MDQ1181981.1 hypothetical protein [Rhodococcus sp. SORGH_AS_0301]